MVKETLLRPLTRCCAAGHIGMVRTAGIEPARASPRDFKSLASTSFATSAQWCGRRESNPRALRHWNLNPALLPIPPRPHASDTTSRTSVRSSNPATGEIRWSASVQRLGSALQPPSTTTASERLCLLDLAPQGTGRLIQWREAASPTPQFWRWPGALQRRHDRSVAQHPPT
jgi:hypothetical protein